MNELTGEDGVDSGEQSSINAVRPSCRGAPRRLRSNCSNHRRGSVPATSPARVVRPRWKPWDSRPKERRPISSGPGGPLRGEEPATGRPAFAEYLSRRRSRSWATTWSRGSPKSSLPLFGERPMVTLRGPHNQRAAPLTMERGAESADGPHWGGRDRPSPCFWRTAGMRSRAAAPRDRA